MSVPSPLDYLGAVTANTRAKAALALQFLLSKGHHPTHFWGYDPNPGNPEHHAGTAVDFMVFGNRWAGDQLADWLWANRVRLGLKHLIWQRRIRSTVVEPGVWRPMADRGSPTANHMDHVHAMFYDTPVRAQASSAIPTSHDPKQPRLLVDGLRGEMTYRALQAYLNREARAGLVVDGDFGPKTVRALERWVKGSVTGSMSTDDVKRFQRKVGATADGAWGPRTTTALQRFLNNHPGKS